MNWYKGDIVEDELVVRVIIFGKWDKPEMKVYFFAVTNTGGRVLGKIIGIVKSR